MAKLDVCGQSEPQKPSVEMLNSTLTIRDHNNFRRYDEYGHSGQHSDATNLYCPLRRVALSEWGQNPSRPSRDIMENGVLWYATGGPYCVPAGQSGITTALREYPA
jgi:hypothetical protein